MNLPVNMSCLPDCDTLVAREGMPVAKVGDMIKHYREAAHLTQGQVAQYANVTRAWISRVEAGTIGRPDREKLERVATVLRIPPETLLAAAGYRVAPLPPPPSRSASQIARELLAAIEREQNEANTPILVPFVENATLSAGPGGHAEAVSFLPVPHERAHQFVAVPVVGTCMEPEVRPGEIAIVDKTAEPFSGEIVAAERDGEYLIKRLETRNGEWWLVANREEPPIRVGDGVRMIGVVVGTQRRLR